MKQILHVLLEIIKDLKVALKQRKNQAILVLVVIGLGIYILRTETEPAASNTDRQPVVTLTTASEYTGGEQVSVIGTVRSISEAKITSEVSGRVVSVPVNLSDSITKGAIVATLENQSELAAVMQAEGAYEAALANAAQSTIGVSEAGTGVIKAKNDAISDMQSAYNTTNGAILNTIDSFFTDPTGSTPGLRLDGYGDTLFLNSERVSYQSLLVEWKNSIDTISVNSDLTEEIKTSKQNVMRTLRIVDTFISLLNNQEDNSRYTDAELSSFSSDLTSLRSTLISTDNSLDQAITDIKNATDSLERAEVLASGGVTSISDAQVKQALGSLRSSQANLAKTIIRSPISGTINSLFVREGDFIGSFDNIAIVANNTAHEIVAFVSDSERKVLKTDDEVTIEGMHTGTVTQISPAVDPLTKKTEIRVTTDDVSIVNGETVRITKVVTSSNDNTQLVLIPLTAVRFAQEDGFVFQVDGNKLLKNDITIGRISGDSVEITSGLESNESFVVDARGLNIGESVTVTTK